MESFSKTLKMTSLRDKTIAPRQSHSLQPTDELEAGHPKHYEVLGPTNNGVSFANVNGNDEDEQALNTNWHIKFGTAEMIKLQKSPTLLTVIKQIKTAYMKRGFNIAHIPLEGQFEPLHIDNTAALPITLNIVS
jgi:hypothetical protein